MRDEYNISELNPRKNPYANRLKKQITINIDGGTIDYFKSLADAKGIPYQTGWLYFSLQKVQPS